MREKKRNLILKIPSSKKYKSDGTTKFVPFGYLQLTEVKMKRMIYKYREMLLSQSYERHKGSLLPMFLQDENLEQLSDGTVKFKDIDYSNADRAIWAPYSHLGRIEWLILSGNQDVKPLCF